MNKDFSARRSGGWELIREVYRVLTGVRKANNFIFLLAQEKELGGMKLKE